MQYGGLAGLVSLDGEYLWDLAAWGSARDPRGFRTRHHREHVEGDYKRPPPTGVYEQRYQDSRQKMKREPVFLSVEARRVAVEAIRYAMSDVHELDVIAIAVTRVHVHVLVRLPVVLSKPTLLKGGHRTSSVDDPARHFMGIAKKESSKTLSREGLVMAGGVWAKRGKVKPVGDRAHFLNVYPYILGHVKEGGAVWAHPTKNPLEGYE